MKLLILASILVLGMIFGMQESFAETNHTIDYLQFGDTRQLDYTITGDNQIDKIRLGNDRITFFLNATSDGTLNFFANDIRGFHFDRLCYPHKLTVVMDNQEIPTSNYSYTETKYFTINFTQNNTELVLIKISENDSYDDCLKKYSSHFEDKLLFENFYYVIYYNRIYTPINPPAVSNIEYDTSNQLSFTVNSDIQTPLVISIPPDFLLVRNNCEPTSPSFSFPVFVVNGDKVSAKEVGNLEYRHPNQSFELVVDSGESTIQIILSRDPNIDNFPNDCSIKYFENAIPYSPKKQMELGINSHYIVCREGLDFVFKPHDNIPICITPETKIKLIERGFLAKPNIWVERPTVQYGNEWDEKITQWVKDNPDVKYTSGIGYQLIKEHFAEKGINVLEIRFAPDESLGDFPICEAVYCPSGEKIMLKVDDPESPLLSHYTIVNPIP